MKPCVFSGTEISTSVRATFTGITPVESRYTMKKQFYAVFEHLDVEYIDALGMTYEVLA